MQRDHVASNDNPSHYDLEMCSSINQNQKPERQPCITKSDQRIYGNILPCRLNRSGLEIHTCKTDLYLSCICVVFENKDCLTIKYLVAKMYSESSNFINPVFESRSRDRIVLAKRICSEHLRHHISGGQNIC